MKEIDGKGKTIRELLNGRRYYVDYYQRDYKWQTKQVRELIEDLTSEFLGNYDPNTVEKQLRNTATTFSVPSSSATSKAIVSSLTASKD